MKIKNIIEFFKYGFFGAITTIFNLFLFYLLNKVGINYIMSNSISYLVAVILSYFLNKKYVFNCNKEKKNLLDLNEMMKFIFIRILSLVVENICLIFVVDILGYNVYLSKISVSIIIILITFIFNKFLIFKK